MTLSCFHVLAITNNATLDINEEDFVWVYVFISLGHTPKNGIAES